MRTQARKGARAQGRWREGARHGSAHRRRGASSGHPRRAHREVAPRGGAESFRESPGMGRAGGTVRERRMADGETATPSRRETEEGDGGDGKLVNNSKFQRPVRKLNFSPSSWPQKKNF